MTALAAVLALAAAAASIVSFLLLRRVRALERSLAGDRGADEALGSQIQAAEEARNRTFAILESMAEGVLVVDPEHRVLVANSALARAIGSEKARLEGRYSWEIFRDADINEMIDDALKRRRALEGEHSIPLSELVFHIRVSPVFGAGEFLGIVAVFFDVTKLKQLEKARSEFVANVSHELKTPLTSIMGFVETLKEGAIDDAANRMRFLGIIEDHSKKLHRLIEDLLSLSRVESGAREFKSEPVDLEALLRQTLLSFERAIEARRLKVESRFSPRPFVFRADAKAMEEILSNLVDNAIKYNREGGRIEVAGSMDAAAVRIEVRDTGIGIPEADLSRVFERFYRVEKSRSKESGGSGLGLSIVKHLVERHGGTIRAESRENEGTVFHLSLPRGS